MQTPEQLLLFPRRLEQAGLQYMITGGLAAILYGEPRLTRDIDLVLQISPEQVDRLPSVFPTPEF